MYLRRINHRQANGKRRGYWVLLESYRTERGPRQRIVSYIGESDEAGRLGIKQAAEGGSNYQEELFNEEEEPEWVEVDIRKVRTERSLRFGDIFLAETLIKRLQLDKLFEELLGREEESSGRKAEIPYNILSELLVISRFCEPSSELYIAEEFIKQSAVCEVLGIDKEKIYDNRLYRGLDKLIEQKEKLQQRLKERLGELFEIKYDILLYDVTSTYFEGEGEENPKAQRGYSRDSRGDCKQVCIGLVVTKEGIPIGYEVFEGNRHDSKTVEEIIEKMERAYGKTDRVWIMDRGMISKTNMEILKAEGRRYIIGTPKNQLKKFEQELLKEDWQKVYEGLEVKICKEEGEVFILCRSIMRKEKDKGITERFIERIEEGLERYQKQCKQGRIKKKSILDRRIGRLLQRNQRASGLFEIKTETTEEQSGNKPACQVGRLEVNWKIKKDKKEFSDITQGCYMLRSNIIDWTGEELWRAYIQLTDAEEAFKIQKNDLQLRPVFHHKEHRVEAHILVCFLAYVLWKTLSQMCKRAGLGNEPRKVVQEMRRIILSDVILPTRNGNQIKLRCVTQPDKHLSALMERLKIMVPQRWSNN
jgi:transposase